MSDTPVISMRLNPDTVAWVTRYAEGLGVGRTDLVRELLEALRERRLMVSDVPAPFVSNDGTHREFPVLVCHHPR